MKLLALLFVVTVTGAAMAATFIALGPASGGVPAAAPTQHVTMEVWPGDRIVGDNLLVRPGRVALTILNYAHHAHTFSVPSLGIERVVLPGTREGPTVTIVRFAALNGVFTWICRLPCSQGMTGDIYVVPSRMNLHGPLWAQS